MANILFLFEGAVREKRYYNVMKRIFESRITSTVNFYCYKTNIHVLYNELKQDESLNIIDLVKERALKENDRDNYTMLNETKFGEIYLIFDLELQDENFDADNIQEMLNLFNDETEHGKLYINYPMIESFKHFETLPDPNYNSYKVKKQECTTYKKDVAEISCINHFNEIDREKYFIIVNQNLCKINEIVNNSIKYDYNTYLNVLNQTNIFSAQRKEIETNESIYVINTFCLWPLDYLGKDLFEEINDNEEE